MKFDERNQFFFKSPLFFISMATAAKFVLLILIPNVAEKNILILMEKKK
jgi:hypothetical protein